MCATPLKRPHTRVAIAAAAPLVLAVAARAQSADLGVTLDQAVNPIVMVGSPNTLTLTVTNAGPDEATTIDWSVALPDELTYVASSSGVHNSGFIAGVIPALASGASEIITVDVTANALTDEAVTIANAFAAMPPDPNAANNMIMATTGVVSDAAPFGTVIFSTFTGSASAVPPNIAGREIRRVNVPAVSPDRTKWATVLDLTGDTATDEILVVWDGTQFLTPVQEGVTILPDLSDTVSTFYHGNATQRNFSLDINDAGVVAFISQTRTTPANPEVCATVDLAGNVAVIARQGDPVPGTTMVNYGSIMNNVQIDNAGNVYFVTDTDSDELTPPPDFDLTDTYLIRHDGVNVTVLFRENTTMVNGLATPAEWLTFLANDAFFVTADGAHTLLRGKTNDVTTADDILAYDNAPVVQEGVVVDPMFTSPADLNSPTIDISLADNGDWYVLGDNDDNEDWFLKNGSLIDVLFQEIYPGANEFWTDLDSIGVDSAGNYILIGNTDITMNGTEIVVLNGERAVARPDQALDLDRNGMFDDHLRISRYFGKQVITADGRCIVRSQVKEQPDGVFILGEVLISFDLGLAAPCPCELDGDDAQVDVFDLLAYLALWFPQDPAADLDGDADVDVFDLLDFLSCWFPASAGGPCP